MLDASVNYIVSGLPRSGTSLLMQILQAGGVPVAFDNIRPPDTHNPRGYYELEGGRIISRIKEKSFPFEQYRGRFIKITAYGLPFLPPGSYRVVYMERDIGEVLDSMEKMTGAGDGDRERTKKAFLRLNGRVKIEITNRTDMWTLLINYNLLLAHPEDQIRRICDFIGLSSPDIVGMAATVDPGLYRSKKSY